MILQTSQSWTKSKLIKFPNSTSQITLQKFFRKIIQKRCALYSISSKCVPSFLFHSLYLSFTIFHHSWSYGLSRGSRDCRSVTLRYNHSISILLPPASLWPAPVVSPPPLPEKKPPNSSQSCTPLRIFTRSKFMAVSARPGHLPLVKILVSTLCFVSPFTDTEHAHLPISCSLSKISILYY